MRNRSLFLGLLSFSLGSCSDLTKVPTIKPKGETGRASFTKTKGQGGLPGRGGLPTAGIQKPDEGVQVGLAPEVGGFLPTEVTAGMTAGGMQLPSDADIIWSDDSRPDADIPFEKTFEKKPQKKQAWALSFKEARRDSARSGKPMVMWFTSTGTNASPVCKTLHREVLATHDFGKWAEEEVIRMKVDMSGASIERGSGIESETIQKRNYAQKLKKQFSVLGLPTVVILAPDGSVHKKLRGYKRGRKSAYLTEMKNAALTIEHNHDVWKRRMFRKGFREWKGKNDQVVMAKMTRYRDGILTLVEPDGARFRTAEKGLSRADRDWIKAEKKRLGY